MIAPHAQIEPLETLLAAAQAEGLEANVRRVLRFVRPHGALELQALGVREGRFAVNRAAHAMTANDSIALCTTADVWPADGVYVVPVQLRAGVETRRSAPGRWYDMGKGESTTDGDVAARLVLGVDCDVKRPARISATDEEMARSVAVAEKAHAYLAGIVGEGALAYVHSGNGRQVWVALDHVPATDETKLLSASILAGLDAQLSTTEVAIDLKLSDAKRLLPACGTIKKKGAPGIAERPHRQTAILIDPSPKAISLDQLWDLHARIRRDCDEVGQAAMDLAKGIKPNKPGPGPAKAKTANAPYEPNDSPFARANAVDPIQVAEWLDLFDSGSLRCPGCGESQGVDVIDHGLKCLHDRCANKGRDGFRTNVDLTAEVRGVDARDAVNLLAERFGFEGLPERRAANAIDRGPYAEYKAREQAREPDPTPAASVFKIWTPDEIWAPLPEPDYLVEGLSVRGSLALLVAYGASLKTWVLEDGALSVATGEPWLQRFATKKGRALLVDFESGTYELRRRAHRIARGRELAIPIDGFAFVSMPAVSLAEDGFYEALVPLAKEYAFIGIDSLAAGSGGIDENDARFARPLQRLKAIAAETGCVIFLLHHSRKGAPGSNGDADQREMVRGSSAIFNACDIVLQLTRGSDDRFICRQTKSRAGKAVEPFSVRVDDTSSEASVVVASNLAVAEDDAAAPTTEPIANARRAILSLLANDRTLKSKNEVCARLRGTRTLKLQALQELIDRHLVAFHDGVFRLASEVGV